MAGRPPKNRTQSITTEIVLGSAAQTIKKAILELNSAVESVKTLDAKGEELTLLVSNKEGAIAELEVTFQEKERQMSLDLDLKMKGSAERTVNEYLSTNGKIAISVQDYNGLKNELAELKANFEKNLNAEIGKAKGMADSRAEQATKLLQAEFNAKEAGNTAQIKSLTEKVTFLEAQGAKWEAALAEERKAGVQRAQAGAIGSVNVTAPGK